MALQNPHEDSYEEGSYEVPQDEGCHCLNCTISRHPSMFGRFPRRCLLQLRSA